MKELLAVMIALAYTWMSANLFAVTSNLLKRNLFLEDFRAKRLPNDVSREGLKFYPWTFFNQSIHHAEHSHAIDGHQMYSGGSVVGKSSTIGIDISSTTPLIFTGEG